MAEILIAGGTGFLGSHLCQSLLKEGHNVIAVDNFITSEASNIKHLEKESGFSFIEQDITKKFEYKGKLDYIMNLASPASPIDYAEIPLETLLVGSLGTYNTLEMAKEKKAVYFMASTSEIYGDPEISPQPEGYWGNVNTVGPRSCYDEAKRFSEAMVHTYQTQGWVDTRTVRIFNTFGPRMRLNDGRAVPNFITQALKNSPITVYGDGSQTRSFCYVDDLIDGIKKLLFSSVTTPTNIGNPNEMTILAMAQKVKDTLNSKSEIVMKPLPGDDPKQRRPDIAKAKKVLGWEPKWSLEDGLEKTIEYFKTAIE